MGTQLTLLCVGCEPKIYVEGKTMAQENTLGLRVRKAETRLRRIRALRQKRSAEHARRLADELAALDSREAALIASLAPEVTAMLRAGKIIP